MQCLNNIQKTHTSCNNAYILKTQNFYNDFMHSLSPDQPLGFSKRVMRQTMLRQEAIFSNQIHELHRVYRKQRELMDEIRRKDLNACDLQLGTSHSTSVQSSITSTRHSSEDSEFLKQKNVSEPKHELSIMPFQPNRRKQTVFEFDVHNQTDKLNSKSSSVLSRRNSYRGLNGIPIVIQALSSLNTLSLLTKNAESSLISSANYRDEDFQFPKCSKDPDPNDVGFTSDMKSFDLNLPLVEVPGSGENKLQVLKHNFDLNACLDEDGSITPTSPNLEAGSNLLLESDELVMNAARTILSISTYKLPEVMYSESLYWFASIVSSSSKYKASGEKEGVSFDMVLPSQTRNVRVKKRLRVSTLISDESSFKKSNNSCGERLIGWGKRGPRCTTKQIDHCLILA